MVARRLGLAAAAGGVELLVDLMVEIGGVTGWEVEKGEVGVQRAEARSAEAQGKKGGMQGSGRGRDAGNKSGGGGGG